MFDIKDLIPDFGAIQIIDVGAMALGAEVYDPLVKKGLAKVLGFECVKAECDRLNAMGLTSHVYLPYAVGDGRERDFYECNFSMTSSLYEPNTPLLSMFQNLENLVQVVKKEKVKTWRLDDIPATQGTDFLKLDVQGAELDVMNGGLSVLSDAVVVHTEVEFVQLYKEQPLFSDVDQMMRKHGFVFHRFAGISGRTFQPLVANNDVNAMLSQALWADAVYVKDFMSLERLSSEKILRMAVILHQVYQSFDLALQALMAYDRKNQTNVSQKYYNRLIGKG